MRTSINITNFSWPAGHGIEANLAAVADHADASGIDTVFVADHLVQAEPGTDPAEPMLEACAGGRIVPEATIVPSRTRAVCAAR